MSWMQTWRVALPLATALGAGAILAASGCMPGPDGREGDTTVSAGAALAPPPTIQFDNPSDPASRKDTLQFGNNNDAYWILGDNAWGAGTLTEGPGPDQYEQNLGVSPTVGANGEVALRIQWRWPQGSGGVKAYPAVLSGMKPGLYSSDSWINGHPVRLLDGTLSQTAPTGSTPGTFLPQQLPITALTAKFARSDVTPPTGEGQLTFDIWLQSQPTQDHGFVSSSITHEIMIPVGNWGAYGSYPDHRPWWWYDHDAVINGRLYHVYCTKGMDGVLRYDFGFLDGHYGRAGWKMIAFQPDVMPVPAGEIDLAAFINYVQTRRDVEGTPWAQGNEYLASVELGIEPVVGSGDLVIYDYKVSPTSTSTPPIGPRHVQAEDGVLSGSGVSVRTDYPGYEGNGFVGPFAQAGDRATVSFLDVAAGTYDLRIRYHAGNLQLNDVAINGIARSEAFVATGTSWGIRTIPGIALPAGTNTVSIIMDWGWIDVDFIELAPAGDRTRRIQAETGSLAGVSAQTYYTGYEGTGFVGPFANAGDRATVSFPDVTAGKYDLRIRYHAGGLQLNDVAINGISRSEAFTATGAGWGIRTIPGIVLPAGTSTVAIIKDWGWFEVDYVELAPAKDDRKIQAENGSITGSPPGVMVRTEYPGYEGNGYVGPFAHAGDRATMSFPNVAAGAYDIRIRYHAGARQVNDVSINGIARSETFAATGTSWATRTISGVALPAGTNTVAIIMDWGWIDVDSIELAPAGRIQAEDGSLTGVMVRTEYPGYDGNGFVGPFANAGDRVTVSFPDVTAGKYDLRIRYHAGAQQVNDVAINGIARSETFAATGSNWATQAITGVMLPAGTSTVAIIKNWGWFEVDYVELAPAKDDRKIQAENGSITGSPPGVMVRTEYPGYEGNGYVGPFANAGDRVTVSFPNVAAGTYDLRIRYHAGAQQVNDVAINGIARSETFAATGTSWVTKTISGVALPAGTNSVSIIKYWGWIDVDYIELAPAHG